MEAVSSPLRRVGIIFSGGPAPAANAVICAAVTSFLESGREVLGFFHGYSHLAEYDSAQPLCPGEHYRVFSRHDLRGLRNQRGVIIGTARANPGEGVEDVNDLDDPVKTRRLGNVYRALVDLQVDALISIGGDDTLKTANLLFAFQQRLPEGAHRIRIVHLPKTIDNDYRGIDFTFGFFTAVDVMAKELMNLRADALATSSYFIVETMGRKAGWLSYGVAIAGEANLVIGVEDVNEELLDDGGDRLSLDKLSHHLVDLVLDREAQGEFYGTIVLAEGLGELLAPRFLTDVGVDEHGHIELAHIALGTRVAKATAANYTQRTGRKKKLRGVQLGYESRCAPPHAFDVMLGSQLGIGAFRGLVERGLDGHMVSVEGQLDLCYIPFSELVDPETLLTQVRFVEQGSDFHQLAHFLEARVDLGAEWRPGRRPER